MHLIIGRDVRITSVVASPVACDNQPCQLRKSFSENISPTLSWEVFDCHGNSTTVIDLTYPLRRARLFRLRHSSAYDHGEYRAAVPSAVSPMWRVHRCTRSRRGDKVTSEGARIPLHLTEKKTVIKIHKIDMWHAT